MPINKVKQQTSALTTANTGEWAPFAVVSDVLQFNSDGTNTRSMVSTAQTQTLTNKTLTSPTLTTPTLGVATATTINKVTITAPATAATLTVLDGTTLTGPAATDTLVGRTSTDTLTNKTLTAPVLGAATGTSLAVTGAITSSGGGVGYAAGAGGIVTQSTNKTTGVTLSKLSGDITMNNASLAADTTAAFTLTNTTIAAADTLILLHVLTGTLGAYTFAAVPAAGSAAISVHNCTPGALGEAIVIRFAVIKAALT